MEASGEQAAIAFSGLVYRGIQKQSGFFLKKNPLVRTWRLYGNPENALDGWLGNLAPGSYLPGSRPHHSALWNSHAISKVALGDVPAAGGRAGGLETGKAKNNSLFCLICAKKIIHAAHLPII